MVESLRPPRGRTRAYCWHIGGTGPGQLAPLGTQGLRGRSPAFSLLCPTEMWTETMKMSPLSSHVAWQRAQCLLLEGDVQ